MRRSTGHAIEFDASDLEQGHAIVGRNGERLTHTIVGVDVLLDIERGSGHARAQRLDHGIASDEHLAPVLAGPRGRCPLGRLLLSGTRAPGGRVLRPLLRLRGRPLALERLAALATGAHGHALLRALLAHGPLALGIACHQDSSASDQRAPAGVSSTRIPEEANPSRRASATAKSLRSRAACR